MFFALMLAVLIAAPSFDGLICQEGVAIAAPLQAGDHTAVATASDGAASTDHVGFGGEGICHHGHCHHTTPFVATTGEAIAATPFKLVQPAAIRTKFRISDPHFELIRPPRA